MKTTRSGCFVAYLRPVSLKAGELRLKAHRKAIRAYALRETLKILRWAKERVRRSRERSV